MAGIGRIALKRKRERKKTEIVFHVYIFMHDTLSMGKRKAEEEIKIGRCRGENKKQLVEKRVKTRIFQHEEKHRKANKQKCERNEK